MVKLTGGNQLLDPKKILTEIGVGAEQQVADLGCGAVGHFVFPASEIVGRGGLVYAVDIRRIVLEGIKNRARVDGIENIETVWSNLEIFKATGIPDGSLDFAFLFNTLFQSSKRKEILTEAIRLVKPGGGLAIIDWKKEKSVLGPPLETRVDPAAIVKFCQQNKFELAKEFSPGLLHFGLLFKKKK